MSTSAETDRAGVVPQGLGAGSPGPAIVNVHGRTFVPMISAGEIAGRVAGLAGEIEGVYAGAFEPPLLVVVLSGAMLFASDLMRALPAVRPDGRHGYELAYIQVASYEGTNSTGQVRQMLGLDTRLTQGRDVILIEDIVDTGTTLAWLVEQAAGWGARSVACCTLLDKPACRTVSGLELRFVGFEIPPAFVLGYGLDYDGLGRGLPALYHLAGE